MQSTDHHSELRPLQVAALNPNWTEDIYTIEVFIRKESAPSYSKSMLFSTGKQDTVAGRSSSVMNRMYPPNLTGSVRLLMYNLFIRNGRCGRSFWHFRTSNPPLESYLPTHPQLVKITTLCWTGSLLSSPRNTDVRVIQIAKTSLEIPPPIYSLQ